MSPRLLSLVMLAAALAFSQPALAAKSKLPKIDEKPLASSDGQPVWKKEDVKLYCHGRMKTLNEDEKQCVKQHKKDVGTKMNTADVQALEGYRKQAADHAKKKGAGRGMKKGKHGMKPDNATTASSTATQTIQPATKLSDVPPTHPE